MPKFFSNILDFLFPSRVELREEEQQREHERKVRKQEMDNYKREKYRVMEWIDNASKNQHIEILTEEEKKHQLELEKHWVEKTLLFTSYQLANDNIQGIDGHPRMYEVEIVTPRKMKGFRTHVYAYVECRGSKAGATVFLYIPVMLGQEEEVKAMAFYDATEHMWLKEPETIDMAWRIFAPLLEDLAA